MQTTCAHSKQIFEVSDEDLRFYQRVSPIFKGVRYDIPPPALCPESRLQRRLALRNQMYVFLRKSSTTGEKIFSGFTPDAPCKVVSKEEWWSDGWDGLSFGRSFDFNREFFPQFEELRNSVPHLPLSMINVENCDYCNNASEIKNCYMIFNSTGSEDCMYSENVWGSRDSIDCTHTKDSELCYDCVMCSGCYRLQSSQDCEDCRDSYFLLGCRSCKDCIGCVNLRRKQYCIFNEQYSKEEYFNYLKTLDLNSYQVRKQLRIKARELWVQHPRPHTLQRQTENVTGNYITSSQNVFDSFFVRNAEDCRYCHHIEQNSKDCYDYCIPGINAELMYECAVSGIGALNLRFCYWCFDGCADLLYCWLCMGSEHCFGCVGLKKKKYCIFNKQYSRQEYEELVPRIIEHMRKTAEWGEFFPLNLSHVPYNLSLAARYFPMTKSEVEEAGLRWYEKEIASTANAVSAADLPDGLPATDDAISVMSSSGRPYKITSRRIKIVSKN